MKKLLLTLFLATPLQSYALFQPEETVLLKQGAWVCYEPQPLIQSKEVYFETQSIEKAKEVLRDSDLCTQLPSKALFVIKDVVAQFTALNRNWQVLKILFDYEGITRSIYTTISDRRKHIPI